MDTGMQDISKISKVLIGVVLTILGFLMILPFLWMFLSSFKTSTEISLSQSFWPQHWTIDNYKNLFTNGSFDIYVKNTLIITAASFIGLFLNAMAGYGFAKFDFKGRKFLFMAVLATMMIPGQVTMIPVYLILNQMQLTNTLLGIILPGLVGAFGIFLFRQFMSNIPDSIVEAARLDGAGEWYIFFHLILPISKPVLAVQGILTFIGGWNAFLWPLIIANDQKYYTLSVGLQLLQGQHTSDYGLQMAGSSFMVIPIIIIFIIFQKYILQGFNIQMDK
ncbi:carbohydrate ABC transporter permease [Liquorilactobacillus satsumensis]|uniref:Sugar ABC superfamily ATP binding cassette transporter, membrane protein n=1 Tax=Liquorilactobacillus satsumensis DSM 16230 = JCM 12392 TaxID=1423801 RepID=A0A0R1UVG6_9LACO|nr:carbohydrate ABC transporter permease [Liquorilactobacillus satsumensis]KRL96990.1 sugar ABC superfamily ATP binding cassette transporter, membrane protein [Liquorilactobacillus satsumensis DSM 16230 = JCM 12392]MCC7667161.1 carbohydrate ABC transporter permease [Liquorilactobacillus satsumensis]MCP9329084.1 carbohydrate ABC transporter permease [Liquorilactobacillus satsumensis]MCP9357754.1 carbohydrate ABC transporter permease [Liquorilactobacillus satsumensis]MCP9371480.1 carbohydrate AB